MSHLLYKDNDMVLRVTGVKDERQNVFGDDTWAVEITLKHEDGTEVSGQNWPISLSYESGTDGNYITTLPHELQVEVGQELIGELHISTDLGNEANWTIPVRVIERGEGD